MTKTLIQGGTIVESSGMEQADILIEDGVIQEINTSQSAKKTIDATGLLIFPGLIDCHVHFREPGYEQKGTMKSESQSALLGGVTTVCDMPNTDPPTVMIEDFEQKVKRAKKIKDCDIRLFFGVTEYRHLMELKRLWAAESKELEKIKQHCCGVKVYLDHSTGDQKAEDETVESIFEACGELKIPLVAHCEDSKINARARTENTNENVSAHSVVRPPEAEAASVKYAIELARSHGTALHIAHISTVQGLELVKQAKREGVSVTCEVAPHHLFLNEGDYAELGTLAKVNPPLRSPEHQQALWEGIKDGTVDCIASDHAPHTLKEKQAEPPLSAPSGVPGVGTTFPLLLTVAASGNEAYAMTYSKIVELCFENPNRIFFLGKKAIHEGAPVDLVFVNPHEEWTIHGEELRTKCKWTPYEGWNMKGRVVDIIRE